LSFSLERRESEPLGAIYKVDISDIHFFNIVAGNSGIAADMKGMTLFSDHNRLQVHHGAAARS